MTTATETQPKRVYLDVCALCRPFDDQNQARIRLETSSVELILAHARRGTLALIISPVHDVEILAITNREERNSLLASLRRLGTRLELDPISARQRADELAAQGFGAADAAHLAFAEQTRAGFVTVDDKLLKKCGRVKLAVWYGTPLAYCDKEKLR